MQESDIIPFKTSPLPEGPWLVFAPHADDETFGMGGSLILANEKNIDVSLLILTDGAQGGDENTSVETLVQTRREEVIQVVEQAGIIDVTFLEQPDHHLASHPKLIARIVSLLNQSKAKSVFFPALTEFHPDHRAAAYIAWQALSEAQYSGNVFAYEITSQQACANYLVDISTAIEKKRRIMTLYQSQLEQNNYIDTIIGLNKSRTYTLPPEVQYAEAFYRFDKPASSLTLNTIEQFRPYWEQEHDQKEILVSVILQTQNDSFDSIQSVLEQTYQNIELILIHRNNHTRSHITHKSTAPNQTQIQTAQDTLTRVQTLALSDTHDYADAANQGLQLCQGDFILILDDDEIIYPGHIESLVTGIREHKSSIIYSDIETNQDSYLKQAFAHVLLLSDKPVALHATLFSREYLSDGLQFNPELESGGHWDFLMQLAQLGSFTYIDTCGGSSRQDYRKKRLTSDLFEHWIQRLGSQGLLESLHSFEQTLQAKNQRCEQLLEQQNALSDRLQSNNTMLEIKEQALAEKNTAISELKQALNTKNNALADTNNAIIEKDKAISDLFAAIKEKDSAIKEKNEALDVLRKNVTDINKLLSEQHQYTAEQTALLNHKGQELSQIQQDNQLMVKSLSWRITAPLRRLKSLLNQGKV